jgi:mannosyltransferase OCH1-like enzyme
MQYQINPTNSKRRSKRDIFPEKHHLELHKSTSNFKSEWSNTICEMDFHEVVLSLPTQPPIYDNTFVIGDPNVVFDINTNPNILRQKEREKEKEREKDDFWPKPTYKLDITKTKKEKIREKIIKKVNEAIPIYEKKAAIIYSKFIIPTTTTNNIIPKNVFICWSTLDLPTKMKEIFEKNQQINPEFNFQLYDDHRCKECIQTFFEEDVVDAFDTLIPGAYKADLWRLCVLFVYGGIYVDIKYLCVNGFTFASVLDNEYLTLDIPSIYWTMNEMHGIYNGFMVSKPRNPFLWKCIRKIVENVRNNFYGETCLYPTGPGLLGNLYFENTDNFVDKMTNEFHCVFSTNLKNIVFRNTAILEIYSEYREEQKQQSKTPYYSHLWSKRKIYDLSSPSTSSSSEMYNTPQNSIIPLKIYQTWYTKDLPEILQTTVNKLKEQNPEFEFYLYDDNDCREFIQMHFDDTIVNAFDSLIPGAYKADLFRYCVLFIQGGIYIDIKYYGIHGFKFISLTDKEYLVYDIVSSGRGIYNALMICKAGNPFLKRAIDQIVENVSKRYYGISTLDPTGPLLLKKIIENDKEDPQDKEDPISFLSHKELFCSSDYNILNYYIYHNNVSILTYHKKYRELQQELFKKDIKKPYYLLWNERNIYT